MNKFAPRSTKKGETIYIQLFLLFGWLCRDGAHCHAHNESEPIDLQEAKENNQRTAAKHVEGPVVDGERALPAWWACVRRSVILINHNSKVYAGIVGMCYAFSYIGTSQLNCIWCMCYAFAYTYVPQLKCMPAGMCYAFGYTYKPHLKCIVCMWCYEFVLNQNSTILCASVMPSVIKRIVTRLTLGPSILKK